MAKVLIIVPMSLNIVYFRAKMIEKLLLEGHSVSAVAFDDEYKNEILSKNIDFYSIKDSSRGANIFKVLTLKSRYKKIVDKINPDYVITYTLKPNIYGVLASYNGKRKIIACNQGIGDVFLNNSFKWRVIREYVCFKLKKSLKKCNKVLFLNQDDKNEYIKNKLVASEKTDVVVDLGIDVSKYPYKEIKNFNSFLMVSRLIKNKGVMEYCECAKIVKQKYPNAVFNLVGAESELKQKDIQQYIDGGYVKYWGERRDVQQFYQNSCVNILPSYREGLGMVNIEAGASYRMSITTNVAGANISIQNDFSGFLVEPGNVNLLVEKVEWCLEHKSEVKQMGLNARKYVEENFNEEQNAVKFMEKININE